MISRRRYMAICVGLAAWFWCTVCVFAQALPASPPLEDERRLALAEAASVNPWDAFQWVERRYKIEAMRFKARDETGFDWAGSDEVIVKTEDAKGWTVSEEIGNIDSGDTHNFDPAKSCIVAVRPGTVVLGKTSVCEDVGVPAPLFFTVEFWEQDAYGIPTLDDFPFLLWTDSHRGPYWVRDDAHDDFIGRARIDLSISELEAAFPNIGDEYVETVVLHPCSHDGTCGAWDFPDYTFTYRITRLRDVRVDLREVLDEAMRTIGARSELEAIIAGLRSLRAPSPRKIDRNQ